MEDNLQDLYAPNGACFGCGPKNPRGLHLKSRPEGEGLVADWHPEPYHIAFSSFASGGIISVLLDCHGNWAATYALMRTRKLQSPPGTVTSEYTVKFLKPTPIDRTWKIRAWPTEITGDRVKVDGEVLVEDVRTASMSGTFVAVKGSHPAFHRWQ